MQNQQDKNILLVGLEEGTINSLQNGIDELPGKFTLDQVATGTKGLEKIASGVFPIVLVGGFLQDMTGLHFAREVKAVNKNIEVALVIPINMNCFNHFEFDGDVDHVLKDPISIAYVQQIVKDSFRRGARLMKANVDLEPVTPQDDKVESELNMTPSEDFQQIELGTSLGLNNLSVEPELTSSAAPNELIHEKLLALRHSTSSRCLMLLSSSGHVIDSVGDSNRLNITNISALIAANYMATSELAKMVGNNSFFRSTYHAGTNYDIFSHGLTDDYLIVSIFDSNSKIGLVRFGIKQVSDSLIDLLEAQDRTFDFSDSNIQSSIEQELDKLFSG